MHSQLTDVVMQRQDGHEDRFLSYINASPVAIFVQSAAGQYCDVNPAGERMLGYSKLELEEVSMPQLVAEESLTAAVEHFAKVQSDGIADGEIILKRKDGSRFWARVTASRLDATRFIAFKQDISQQKEYEVELARAKEQAIKANQGKSLFLSNMSHEIRTPLNAIVAMTNVLRFTGMTSEQLHCLNNIELSVDCLIGLISDVLDISRIESGKVELELEPFWLQRCIDEVVKLVQPKVMKKHLAFHLECAAHLPRVVVGDQLKIKQILLHLLANAVKFTDTGTITLQLALLSAVADRCQIRLSVTDTGIGIAPCALPTLFEPFAPGHENNPNSTGLGLAICRQLAELMGGKIWVESEAGHGTQFHLELALEVAADDRLLSPERLERGEVRHDRRMFTVLVAEDNQIALQAIITLLQKLDCHAVAAQDGRAALALWENGGIDLLLLDIQLPDMSGAEVVRAMRAAEQRGARRTPVVVVTAHVSGALREQLLFEDIDGYLCKPLKLAQLVSVVNQFYREPSLSQQ